MSLACLPFFFGGPRSLRQGERLLRQKAHRQEENPREEVHFEPSLQRVFHLRHPHRPPARHQHRVPGHRLRSHHQERGGGEADPGGAQCHSRWRRALERGVREPPQARGQVAQSERVLILFSLPLTLGPGWAGTWRGERGPRGADSKPHLSCRRKFLTRQTPQRTPHMTTAAVQFLAMMIFLLCKALGNPFFFFFFQMGKKREGKTSTSLYITM